MIVIFAYAVVASCGQSVAENCTYFQSNGGEIGYHYINVFIKNITTFH